VIVKHKELEDSMAKTEKVLTAAQVKRLIAKERKLWEAERVEEAAKRTARLMATESMIATAKAHGQVLTQNDRHQARRQSQCNHLKGGLITMSGGRRIFPVTGDDTQYAVIKHQMIHGDIWVRCIRCGKWWKPPIRSQYPQHRDFWRAMFEYEEALAFPTRNRMSGSVLCRFMICNPDGTQRDGAELIRERLANSASQ
jgi:hypothetical protein